MSVRDEAAGGRSMMAADLGCHSYSCQRGLGDPPMDCIWPECPCGTLYVLVSAPSPRDQACSAMLGALEKVAAWELPPSGMFWDKERNKPMSYAAAFGSIGEREHFQKIASEAVQLARSAGIEPKESGR